MNRLAIHNRRRVLVAALLALGLTGPVQAAGPGLNGRILALDEKGLPRGTVAGAKIEFKNLAGNVVAQVTADKKGKYKVDLPAGQYSYTVRALGFRDEDAGRGIRVTLSDGYAVYDFCLIRGKNDSRQKRRAIATATVGTVKGYVREKTASGKLVGIPRATIVFRKSGSDQLPKVVTRGDEPKQAGSYEVALEAGFYQVSVLAPGYEARPIPQTLAVAGGKMASRDFMLMRLQQPEVRGQGIKGLITLANQPKGANSPLQQHKVKLSIRPLVVAAGGPGAPLRPDAEGKFQRDLCAGRYQVVAEAEGFRTAFSGPTEVLAGTYTVVKLRLLPVAKELTFIATVYERLPDGVGRKPLVGVTVLLRKEGQPLSGAPRGTTGAGGKVSLKVGAPGLYQALARMTGYKPAGVRTEIRGAGDNRADLELIKEMPRAKEASLAVLNLRVVAGKDKLALPIANAKIVISRDGRTVKSGTSDREGRQSYSLPPGTYRVEATRAGYFPARTDVTLAAKDLRRDIVLTQLPRARAALNLRVVERLKGADKAIARAQVVITQKDKRVGGDEASADGCLAVPLPPGLYTVVVTKSGFKTAVVQVNLAAKDVNQDIVLTRAGTAPGKKVSLNLRAVERLKAGDKAVQQARVVISQKDERVTEDTTGPDGRLTVSLGPGLYTVVVTKSGFKTAVVQVNLAAKDVNQDIVLIRAGTVPAGVGDTPRLPAGTATFPAGSKTCSCQFDHGTGEITITLSSDTATTSTIGGSLVVIDFHGNQGELGGLSARSPGSAADCGDLPVQEQE
jgi:hypothetical protein